MSDQPVSTAAAEARAASTRASDARINWIVALVSLAIVTLFSIISLSTHWENRITAVETKVDGLGVMQVRQSNTINETHDAVIRIDATISGNNSGVHIGRR